VGVKGEAEVLDLSRMGKGRGRSRWREGGVGIQVPKMQQLGRLLIGNSLNLAGKKKEGRLSGRRGILEECDREEQREKIRETEAPTLTAIHRIHPKSIEGQIELDQGQRQ